MLKDKKYRKNILKCLPVLRRIILFAAAGNEEIITLFTRISR